jgi:hypothetical protein
MAVTRCLQYPRSFFYCLLAWICLNGVM